MANTLQDPKVATALERMYAESQEQVAQLRDWRDELQRLSSASAQERADAFGAFYIPVTPDAGRLLYMLVRAAQPTTIVEFGMSFGISAIHLASAVHDNGAGGSSPPNSAPPKSALPGRHSPTSGWTI
ncbi:family 3 O-methyltransferase [Mycobacterium xenopi 4042]|uniref:Family 3 O-methyltransferase n=1 Tax=Mycobacterium xenopi 4042 TaxID=1299334 RepID=X8CJ90_MYCXE|nr:family 3 O-methyltransferase [Mycobacterium xenopi 3993]EUA56447.1 family 3 O-methyltransferase [Mycobacterium xenopi 4042]